MQKPLRPSNVVASTVEGFLKSVLRSSLLTRDQLQNALRGVPPGQRQDPEALANHLIRTGKLSRFQARKLLQGAPLGLVLGPMQVLAPIAKGGMGTVYLARDNRSGHLIALKVLPPKRAREEVRVLTRFRREMEMCQRVAHPHLVWTYDVGVCQGVYYIAMEYIPGKSLYRLVVDGGTLEVPRAARLFIEVLSALDHAHCRNIIHRDVKPSNILITPNDHAKLLDLGLALVCGETNAAREIIGGEGYIVGTMDYIAPEQAENAARVDARSDIYALGCTLYYALTGRPPFPNGSSLEKIHSHQHEEPASVSQFNPAVPDDFLGLLRQMMAKNPAERFPSAAAAAEALTAWVDRVSILPLDKPGDQGYDGAVASLATTDPSSEELTVDDLSVVQDSSPDQACSGNGSTSLAEVQPAAALSLPVAEPQPCPLIELETATLHPYQSPVSAFSWRRWGAALLVAAALLGCLALGVYLLITH